MSDNYRPHAPGDILLADDLGDNVKVQRVRLDAGGANPSIDAFGRLRVSNAVTIFDSKLISADKAPLFWDEALESGGGITSTTPTLNKPYLDIVSSDETAGVFTRQTFRHFYYQPGKSHLLLLTGVLELASGVLTGVQRRLGYFDDNNGAFFASVAGVIAIATRSSDSGAVVDTPVLQADWDDPMDGTGRSKMTADFSKAQIFVIDFQWLSAGRVRFGLEIAGTIEYVHSVDVANVAIIPWASTPNLPLRYQMITTADSGVASMRVICSTVISEGDTDTSGVVHHKGTGGAAVVSAVEDTLYALIGIRLKTTHLGATIRILKGRVQIQTASEFIEWLILFNPAVAGAFVYGNLDNSAIQFALGVTANVVTGGIHMDGDYAETGGGNTGGSSEGVLLHSDLDLGIAIDGTRDTIVLAYRPIGGVSAAAVEGALVWREQL